MCGIAGMIGRLDEPNRAVLERMSNAMVHRGPDASGTWVSAPDARGWGALLAHRRLSILDLSPAGAQPMVDPVTGHVVVLNGEIYNFGDLRRRLMAEGQAAERGGDDGLPHGHRLDDLEAGAAPKSQRHDHGGGRRKMR